MRLVLPVLGLMLGASACCCGDLLTAGLERLGVEAPVGFGGPAVPEALVLVPEYQGARFEGGAAAGGIASGTWVVPGGDVGEIVEFYRLVLELDGWEIDHLLDGGAEQLLQASKDGALLSLTASDTPSDEVVVVISLQEGSTAG